MGGPAAGSPLRGPRAAEENGIEAPSGLKKKNRTSRTFLLTRAGRPGKVRAMKPENTPLVVEIVDRVLVVKIGVETLEWASRPENGGPLIDCKVDKRRRLDWARDVANEAEKQDEVGSTPLIEFFDGMMQKAADNGSSALLFPKKKIRKNA